MPTVNTTVPLKITQEPNDEFPLFKISDKFYNLRIITPREAYRLMGFTDQDFDKAKEVATEGTLYHTAGNSIVVQVLEAIFKELYNE